MNETEAAALTKLGNDLAVTSTKDQLLNNYYEGAQSLQHIGLAVPPELRKFETIVNWPRLAVDSLEERLDIEGFRMPDEDRADTDLWRVWEANDMPVESQLADLDALIYGRSFLCIGANEVDPETPIITVESPREMAVIRDARTHRITAAVRMYLDDQNDPSSGRATLYMPDATIWLRRAPAGWEEVDRDGHNLGEVTVVPLLNRGRTGSRSGVSEMTDIIPLTDAAARSLTNLQLASETHAVPQRWALGVSKGDFADTDGKPLPVWQAYFGAIWAASNSEAKFGQFSASDLRNFHETGKYYAQIVAGLTGLPPHYLGFVTDNPASADAIRSAESRLVKRAERRQRAFGGAYEQAMRLVRRIQTGEWDPRFKALEVMWRDPATPTVAQKADATVKLVQSGILPVEAAWEELGYSATRIEKLRALRRSQVTDDILGATAAMFREPVPVDDAG